MPTTIYSWLFQEESIAGGGVTVLPVPDGFVWVVRDISGVMTTPLGVAGDLGVTLNGALFAAWSWPDAYSSPFHWEGHVVAPGGNELTIQCSGSSVVADICLSGYQLTVP